ncbi:hypothetical protein AAFC00_003629 [Neodothiora populina]|uniref:WD40 repeat-like protein n=1 Tax=Neodothiora populina TaxID=2781224 RepID=A0ABR3PF12_9PEZI
MVKRKREDLQAARAKTEKNARFASDAATKKSKKSSETSESIASPKTGSVVKKSSSAAVKNGETTALDARSEQLSIQIVTGSYERVLHGFVATFPTNRITQKTTAKSDKDAAATADTKLAVTDTFLFAAHSSALRCLALSPPTEAHKRILATGSTDERINLYNLSTSPPVTSNEPQLPSLANTSIAENSRNRELGSLLHHARSVNKLQFPTKGKLFSAADDNTVAISRTRDWTVLSTIKCPIPKPVGRPSGDTAGPGEVPAGVNDFAIHPSMKVMVSVGKGEKSMRLWNLVTGKKAGVLNFDRELLQAVGEGRYGSGEGRKVLWSEDGEEYIVGFERGAVIYGMDSVPKATIRPSPLTKIHQMHFLPASHVPEGHSLLAVSTEDGRIMLYDVKKLTAPSSPKQKFASCEAIAQIGGVASGFIGRIKDFVVLPAAADDAGVTAPLLIVTGSSDGAVRVWKFSASELSAPAEVEGDEEIAKAAGEHAQVGTLIGAHETGHRITCLAAFVMDGPTEQQDSEEDEDEDGAVDEVSASDSE